MTQRIRYELVHLDLLAHEFCVRMRVSGPLHGPQLLQLPAWIPGSYMIRDFARNITEIAAIDDNRPVALRKLDKQTWQVPASSGDLIVDYRVYAFDLSVRTAYLDGTRAYFNGPCLFLSLHSGRDAGWELQLPRPVEPGTKDWRVATTLPAEAVDEQGFGLYAGIGYDSLIDSPVEMGVFEEGEFAVLGRPHRFAVSDGGRFDMPRICRDIGAVCSEHAAMFGVLPVQGYLFLVLATGDGYGGLEHADSTSLICKRSDLPAPGSGKPDKGYRQFLGLCSHEYFHLWNVKRIRPGSIADSDLSKEAYTELLWAFEGITSYYDELALVRSGVLSTEDYLDLFANTVSRVLRSPGRARQSVAESSFDAWTKFYKQDENAPNAIVSYYAKGALVSLGLDVALREASGDRLSLDDLMRRLWERYGATGIAVPERAIEREVAGLLGTPFERFFDDYVYGTTELPLDDWFARLGIGYRVRAALNTEDLGGHKLEAPSEEPPPALSARFEAQPAGLRLTHVIAGGAAHAAGLAAGDLLVAVDGERVTAANLGDLLRRVAGASAPIHFFRRDRLMTGHLPSCPAPADTCDVWLLPDGDLPAEVVARRAAWLRSNRVLLA